MKCPGCDSECEEKNVPDYHFTESGFDNIHLKDWPASVCSKCDVVMPILMDPEQYRKIIGNTLLNKPLRLTHEEIFFMRKTLGFKAHLFAELLGVERVTVSRWENGREEIDYNSDIAIRMLYLIKFRKSFSESGHISGPIAKLHFSSLYAVVPHILPVRFDFKIFENKLTCFSWIEFSNDHSITL